MNENSEQQSNEHSEEPEIDGVDVAAGSGVSSAGKDGPAESNGRKRYAASEATSAVADPDPGTGSDEGGAAGATDEGQDLATQLAAARREIASLKDSWSRERAEFQNYKRRQATEFSRMRTIAVADFMSGLLPVLDNLETVLHVQTENEAVRQYVDGVSMIHKELISVLDRHNIKIIRPKGEPFSPDTMEAIAMEVREEVDRETVLEVFQDGLVMEFEDGQRQVLRPARVRVGRPAADTKQDA